MARLILILISFVLSVNVWAGNIPATFYVDSVLGSDNSSTTTGLATDNAWATVAKVNAFSRTNILTYSEDFTHSPWTISAADTLLIADNAVAPDGTTTADRIQETATSAGHRVYTPDITVVTATPYSFSSYAKAGERNWLILSTWVTGGYAHSYFDLANGVVGTDGHGATAKIESVVNGWYRCSVVRTSNGTVLDVYIWETTGDGVVGHLGDNVSGLYIWGAHLGTTSLSPYIPTTTAAVTASFQPGDNILFKRGQTWAETLTVPSSGTSGAHITFGSYGGGAKPNITGGVDMNGKTYVDTQFTNNWQLPNFIQSPSFPSWR